MLSLADIARGVQGAIGVLRLDPSAPFLFENSREACLRSFRVMFVAAPLYSFYVLIHHSHFHASASEGEILLVEALRYVVDWLLYPVLFYEIARRRGWTDLYPRYITILNWINLPAIIVVVLGAAISAVAPQPFAGLLSIALQGLLFYWFLAATRLALSVGWGMASILLVVNFVPTVLLSLLVDRILGLTP